MFIDQAIGFVINMLDFFLDLSLARARVASAQKNYSAPFFLARNRKMAILAIG